MPVCSPITMAGENRDRERLIAGGTTPDAGFDCHAGGHFDG